MLAEGNVTLMVRDVARSVRFYTETLGLRLLGRVGEDTAELDGAGITLRLHHKRSEIPELGSGTAAVGFRVEDLPASLSTLASRGVAVGRILSAGDGSMALFDDPDENHLYLFERRVRAP